MAGFKRFHKYTWRIDFGAAGYCRWESTAKKAFEVRSILSDFLDVDELPMYCDGKLV